MNGFMRNDMFIISLNDERLLSGLKKVSSNERVLQVEFLVYLAEIEKRKLFAREGYSSLFRFIVEELHYPESSALKRIWVARMARKFPQIYYLIADGKISLTALSKLCPFLNQSNVDTLLSEAENKSVREVEHVIVRHFPKADVKDSVEKAVTPLSIDKVHIHFTADSEFSDHLKRVQELLSHKYPEGKLCDILGEALRLLLSQIQPKDSKKEVDNETAVVVTGATIRSEADIEPQGSGSSRYIPKAIKDDVFNRDAGACTYVSHWRKNAVRKGSLSMTTSPHTPWVAFHIHR